LVATGAGAYAHESGATLRTSIGLGTTDDPTFQDVTIRTLTVTGIDGESGGWSLDRIPSFDETCEGVWDPVSVNSNDYGIGGLLSLSANGSYDTADKDDIADQADVIACEADTGEKIIIAYGSVRNDDKYNFTAGNIIYLGDDGEPTETVTSQRVGIALSADVFFFAPQPYETDHGLLYESIGGNVDLTGDTICRKLFGKSESGSSGDSIVSLPTTGICRGETVREFYFINRVVDGDHDLDILPHTGDYILLDGVSCEVDKKLMLEDQGDYAHVVGGGNGFWMVLSHSGAVCD
jgi:hypothetical protein